MSGIKPNEIVRDVRDNKLYRVLFSIVSDTPNDKKTIAWACCPPTHKTSLNSTKTIFEKDLVLFEQPRVVVLSSDDGYDALYIDGKLIETGSSPLGEGDSLTYLLQKSEEFNFTSKDVVKHYLEPEDSENVEESGEWHEDITDYLHDYWRFVMEREV